MDEFVVTIYNHRSERFYCFRLVGERALNEFCDKAHADSVWGDISVQMLNAPELFGTGQEVA